MYVPNYLAINMFLLNISSEWPNSTVECLLNHIENIALSCWQITLRQRRQEEWWQQYIEKRTTDNFRNALSRKWDCNTVKSYRILIYVCFWWTFPLPCEYLPYDVLVVVSAIIIDIKLFIRIYFHPVNTMLYENLVVCITLSFYENL